MKKNKAPKWWLLAIVATPLLLMLCLHIGIALGQYFGININVPGIGAADWFLFAGSYLGGAMTLLGVVATLKHERSIHHHQLMIESIEKEKALQTVANLNQKERLQLINLAREYIFLRLQNAKRDCFPNT